MKKRSMLVSTGVGFPNKYRKVAFFISVILFSFFPFIDSFSQTKLSQRSNLDFKIINVKEGLSDNNVFHLYQDREGYIWVSTENGLNVFNGHEIKIFRNEGKSSNEISGNEISCVIEDNNGNIWIGTLNNGLCRYNKKTGKFTFINLEVDDQQSIYAVHTLHILDDFLWIGDESGFVTKLNTNDLTFKNFIPSFDLGRKIVFNDAIKSFYSDDNFLWASSNSGYLFKIDLKTEKFEILNISEKVGEVVQITSTKSFDDDKLILTTSSGILSLDKFTYKVEKEIVFGDDYTTKVNDFFKDKEGNTWVLSEGIGILYYSSDGNRLILNKEQFKYQWIPELDARTIIQSKDGLIWIATYGGGIIQFNPKKSIFNHYLYDPADLNGLRDDGINCFNDATNGDMWIGTDAGGLHKFNPSNGTFNNFINSPSLVQFDNFSILTILKDDPGENLWLGTYKFGINYFNPSTGKNISYKYIDQNSFHPSHAIYAIENFTDSLLWLGTNGHGVLVFNKYSRKYINAYLLTSDESSLHNDYIRAIFKDRRGDMWVGSYGGLVKYLREDKFKRFENDPDDSLTIKNGLISQIFEDSRGLFWLGNRGEGLMLMDRDKDIFYHYGKAEGLNINHIFGITEDVNGVLWLTSNNGLISAKIENSSTPKPKLTFRYFYKENGLQDNTYTGASILLTKNNEVFVGGQNGFNFFKPEEALALQSYELDVYLEDLSVNGKLVSPEEYKGINKSIEYLDTLILNVNNSDISLNITAINFEVVQNLYYSYKLEGYEEEWNFIDNVRRVTYTNLPLGKFELRVRASVDGKTWVERDKHLSVIVVGPWYWYWYGKTVLVIIFLSLIFLVYLFRIDIIKKQKIKLQLQVEEQSKEIRKQNKELVLRNSQLNNQYEEILKSREEIKVKNDDLEEMHNRLHAINSGLEAKVQKRTHQLNNTIDQLNESVQKLDAFLSKTSNELDIPIKSIQGFLTILKMEQIPEKSKNYLSLLDKNISKIELLKKQLVDFSNNSVSSFNFEKINIKLLLKKVINEFEIIHDLNDFKIINSVDEKVEIYSDMIRLKIVFTNILSNSIIYKDSKKTSPEIEILSNENVANWEIIIKDNGLGIKKEAIPNIFQMYYRASRLADGVGLGLFVTKEILINLKASISIDSTLGKGTSVQLSFPKIKR